MGETLQRFLYGRNTKKNVAEMNRFIAEHSVSRFTEDLIKFINTSLTRFKTFNLYDVRRARACIYRHLTYFSYKFLYASVWFSCSVLLKSSYVTLIMEIFLMKGIHSVNKRKFNKRE